MPTPPKPPQRRRNTEADWQPDDDALEVEEEAAGELADAESADESDVIEDIHDSMRDSVGEALRAEAHRPVSGLTPEDIARIPSLPGVYVMRNGAGVVLYVGKASNLHSRVNSYFTKAGDARFNVRVLMQHVATVETIITGNEKEAFLLENTLIKQHQPRYNIRLRDDKTYVSVRIDLGAEWPRALVMRRRPARSRRGPDGASDAALDAPAEDKVNAAGVTKEGVMYLGPYASASGVRDTLRHLQRVFPIRSCPDTVLRNRARPCLLHSIGRCCAPCVMPVNKEYYRELVEGTVLFLKGRTGEVVERLEARMKSHAAKMEFEQAGAVRDRIRAMDDTTERQGVHRHGGSDVDVIALEQAGGRGAFVIFSHRNGILVSSRPFVVHDHGREADDLMEEFITRYYETELPPRELLVYPLPRGDEFLNQWLAERRESKVEMLQPQRGEKLRLIETAQENARRLLEQHLSGQKTYEEIQRDLMDKFGLASPPDVVECFDISTIQGFATVGSMVTIRGGEPDKNRYRRFRIKTFEGMDDFAALREVLMRRLRRVVTSEEPPPSVMVIDGGKGQLGVAVQVLEDLGLAGEKGIPLIGMAKSRVKHRGQELYKTEERFFLPGRKNPVVFRTNSPTLYMLQRLRDEAHRFGITYHRELRGRMNLRSRLEAIAGIGRTRASRLLKHFGSFKRLSEATVEEIAAAPGIPGELAGRLFEWLRVDTEQIEKEVMQPGNQQGTGEEPEAEAKTEPEAQTQIQMQPQSHEDTEKLTEEEIREDD